MPFATIADTLGLVRRIARRKISVAYKAKYQLWAACQQVVAAPKPPPLPKFGSRKFSSHQEMNVWKRQLLRETAQVATSNG